MNLHSDPIKSALPVISYAASVIVHALVFFISGILLHFSFTSPTVNSGYVEISTGFTNIHEEARQLPVLEPDIRETPFPEEKEAINEEPEAAAKEKQALTSELPEKTAAIKNITFNGTNTDTSSLNNVYSEKTLNVSIKYPSGWAYIDQNRKNKLDGVTFMAASGNIKPPPYVHLAVQTKDMFIESRYKYSIKTWNYTAYYNDPEEMAGQVSQVFYIRTETDEDYSIKFIMKGMDNFKAFQPVFFGMVKTFKFGDGWF